MREKDKKIERREGKKARSKRDEGGKLENLPRNYIHDWARRRKERGERVIWGNGEGRMSRLRNWVGRMSHLRKWRGENEPFEELSVKNEPFEELSGENEPFEGMRGEKEPHDEMSEEKSHVKDEKWRYIEAWYYNTVC
jgi:hypothetical protein